MDGYLVIGINNEFKPYIELAVNFKEAKAKADIMAQDTMANYRNITIRTIRISVGNISVG